MLVQNAYWRSTGFCHVKISKRTAGGGADVVGISVSIFDSDLDYPFAFTIPIQLIANDDNFVLIN